MDSPQHRPQHLLLAPALIAQKQAYAPYSNQKIGSSVLWDDGTITQGCNIENASYGGTVCAERVAIWKGISENNIRRIIEILVISPGKTPWPPCGICRQVLSEFGNAETKIHWTNGINQIKTKTLAEMLPETFDSTFLLK